MIPRLSKAGWRKAPGRLHSPRSNLIDIREAHIIESEAPPHLFGGFATLVTTRRFAPPLLERRGIFAKHVSNLTNPRECIFSLRSFGVRRREVNGQGTDHRRRCGSGWIG